MIKLPDYSQCVELKHLLLNMGIHEIEGKQLMAELPDLDQEVEEEKDRLKKRIDELNFIKEKVDFYDDLEKTIPEKIYYFYPANWNKYFLFSQSFCNIRKTQELLLYVLLPRIR